MYVWQKVEPNLTNYITKIKILNIFDTFLLGMAWHYWQENLSGVILQEFFWIIFCSQKLL
jgi:hypothetical protein